MEQLRAAAGLQDFSFNRSLQAGLSFMQLLPDAAQGQFGSGWNVVSGGQYK